MTYDVFVLHWEKADSKEHAWICAYENETDALDACRVLEKHGDPEKSYYVDTLQVKE